MSKYNTLKKIREGSLIEINTSKNPQVYADIITGYFVGMLGILHCKNPKYGYAQILKIQYRETEDSQVKVGFLEEVIHY